MPANAMKTDAELIHSLKLGNLQALGDLYDRHQRQVFQTALTITGDAEAAADLLQDVFLRLYRYAETIDTARPLEPWLYRVTANLCYTWLKSRRRWLRPLEEAANWLAGEDHNPARQDRYPDDDWQQLQKALQGLSLSQRMVVVLYYLNDQTVEEIASILDVPVGTVKSRLHYGREALKKQMVVEQGESIVGLGYDFT